MGYNYPDGMRGSDLPGGDDVDCPNCGGGDEKCPVCDGEGVIASGDARTYWLERRDYDD